MAMAKPPDRACPHLSFLEGKASCAVHDTSWFKKTVCHVYGNPDIDPDFAPKRGKPCRPGASILSGGGLHVTHPHLDLDPMPPEDMDHLGEWPEDDES